MKDRHTAYHPNTALRDGAGSVDFFSGADFVHHYDLGVWFCTASTRTSWTVYVCNRHSMRSANAMVRASMVAGDLVGGIHHHNSATEIICEQRDRSGAIIALTYRVGRHMPGSAELIRDLVAMIVKQQSLLLLGPPGVGKDDTVTRHHEIALIRCRAPGKPARLSDEKTCASCRSPRSKFTASGTRLISPGRSKSCSGLLLLKRRMGWR